MIFSTKDTTTIHLIRTDNLKKGEIVLKRTLTKSGQYRCYMINEDGVSKSINKINFEGLLAPHINIATKIEKDENGFITSLTYPTTNLLDNAYLQFYNKVDEEDILYEFKIKGNTGIYNPVFKIENERIYTACDCKAGQEDMLCWHRSYILSENEKFLILNNRKEQLKLIHEASKTQGGTNMIRYARDRFPSNNSINAFNKTVPTIAIPKVKLPNFKLNNPLWLKIINAIPIGIFTLLFIISFAIALFLIINEYLK